MNSQGKILIIDDSEIAQKLLLTILEHENYEVKVAMMLFKLLRYLQNLSQILFC